jgi:hypothetical protein
VNALVQADPYADDPLAQRLQRLEIATPDAIVRIAEEPARAGASIGGRKRRAGRAWQVGVAALLATTASILVVDVFHVGTTAPITLHVPGYVIEVAAATSAAPRMSREQATAAALEWIAHHSFGPDQHSQFAGFGVTAATYEPNVLKVWHECGAHWSLNSAQNLWVVDLRAPPQLGWQYVQASVLVNDDSGQPQYTDALMSRTPILGC